MIDYIFIIMRKRKKNEIYIEKFIGKSRCVGGAVISR